MKLIQGMYSDLNCKLFGLSYGQSRDKEIIQNAGWFNQKGEKLGYGDLSWDDMSKISSEISEGDIFIVLSESDCQWNIPAGVDRFNPGIDYVMNHTKILVSGLKKNKGSIFNLGIVGVPTWNRDELFRELGYKDKKFVEDNSGNIRVLKGTYYGLDEYQFWADGELKECWVIGGAYGVMEAAKNKLKDDIYQSNLHGLRSYFNFSTFDIAILQDMADKYGPDCSSVFRAMLGSRLDEYVELEVSRRGCGAILANVNGLEHLSDNIPGLPNGYFAYRVD